MPTALRDAVNSTCPHIDAAEVGEERECECAGQYLQKAEPEGVLGQRFEAGEAQLQALLEKQKQNPHLANLPKRATTTSVLKEEGGGGV